MQNAYDRLPCIYFSASVEGVILQANEALCQAVGYSKEELIGRKLASIFTLSTRLFQQTHIYPLLQLKGLAEEIYITLKHKSGDDVPVLVNVVTATAAGIPCYEFAGISITKRKRFEEEIIAAKKAAEKALQENTALKAAQESLQRHTEELDIQIGLEKNQNEQLRQFTHLATHTLQEPLRKLLFYAAQLPEGHRRRKTNLGQHPQDKKGRR